MIRRALITSCGIAATLAVAFLAASYTWNEVGASLGLGNSLMYHTCDADTCHDFYLVIQNGASVLAWHERFRPEPENDEGPFAPARTSFWLPSKSNLIPSHKISFEIRTYAPQGSLHHWRLREFTFSWWFMVGVLLPLPAWVTIVRLRRAFASNRCSCGYDLRENTSGYCPECGATVNRKVTSRVPNAVGDSSESQGSVGESDLPTK